MNGLDCCLATSCTTGAATVYMGFVPVAASFNLPRSPMFCRSGVGTNFGGAFPPPFLLHCLVLSSLRDRVVIEVSLVKVGQP